MKKCLILMFLVSCSHVDQDYMTNRLFEYCVKSSIFQESYYILANDRSVERGMRLCAKYSKHTFDFNDTEPNSIMKYLNGVKND